MFRISEVLVERVIELSERDTAFVVCSWGQGKAENSRTDELIHATK